MNVLSLFDGMSCGQIALNRIGVKIDSYYASEVDKYARGVTSLNYPNTIHLGDAQKIPYGVLPKIDLLLGGSPCQGFSFAGKQKGSSTKCGVEVTTLEQYLELKKDNFQFEGQSYLFWEYIYVLRRLKPKYFLLENVKMNKKWLEMFNGAVGVEPIMIDSALVSAQHRKRWYWTNIPNVEQPEDLGLLLEDILEDPTHIPVIKNHGELIYKPHKSQCLDANYFKGADNHGQRTGCIEVGHAEINGHDFLKRVYSPKGKSHTLTAVKGGNQERKVAIDSQHWRKLTPLECEKLQTVPEGYTSSVSNSQRYKMLGNGWTVDVIAHILKNIPEDVRNA